jgi:4-hydroxybenzoate polyprenyltransferase
LFLLLRDIKVEHSIFALPFALSSLWVATGGAPGWRLLGLVVLTMVSARTYAMSFNRWADRRIDALNPRTRGRATASGKVSGPFALGSAAVSALVFVLACSLLNPLCLALSPVVLAALGFYSFTKRFTSLSHLFLGLSLGLSAPGAWIAATGALDAPPLVLGGAVLFWVAGFDVIYATQDLDFDRRAGLHSLVTRLGLPRALVLARVFHAACLVLLALFGAAAGLGWAFYAAWALACGVIVWEHRLVRPDDLSRVQTAFFTANGWVGVLVLGGVLASVR